MIWRLTHVTPERKQQRQTANGNTVIETQAALATFKSKSSYYAGTLLVYRAQSGMRAYLKDDDVTDRLSQDEWAGLYAQALAAQAITGKLPNIERDLPL